MRAPSSWLLYSFDMSFSFLNTSLLPAHTQKIFQEHLFLSLPQSWKQTFFQITLGFFWWRTVFRNQDLSSRLLFFFEFRYEINPWSVRNLEEFLFCIKNSDHDSGLPGVNTNLLEACWSWASSDLPLPQLIPCFLGQPALLGHQH